MVSAELTRRTFITGVAVALIGACGRSDPTASQSATTTTTAPRLAPNEKTAALQRFGLIDDLGADLALVAQLDEAGGPPGSETFVGSVPGTNAFIGVRFFEDSTVSVYVCNGTADRPATAQHWARGPVAESRFELASTVNPFASTQLAVRGERDGDVVTGEVVFPDGQVNAYRAELATGAALLLRLDGEVAATLADHDRPVGEAGILEHDAGAARAELDDVVREGTVIPMGWIRLPSGDVRGGCTCYSGYVWCQCTYGHWHRLDDRCGTAGYDW